MDSTSITNLSFPPAEKNNAKNENLGIQVMSYNNTDFEESHLNSIHECAKFKNENRVLWINIEGMENDAPIKEIAHIFDFHELLVEDILHTDIRPKIDFYDHQISLVMKMLKFNQQTCHMESEQVSLVMGPNYVISFQEEAESDVFDNIRAKIRSGNNKLTRSGPDFLLYSLIDSIVDNYFIVLEHIGDDVETLEEEILNGPNNNTLKSLYALKRELIFTRRSVWPLREMLSVLDREESPGIKKETRKYIRDVYDHTIQVIDAVESSRDVMASLLDIYISSISNRMNSVMKTLTIISTIFMPLTFIAGIYGMNFENMPELKWKYGYFYVLAIMLVIALIMLRWFKKKKWL